MKKQAFLRILGFLAVFAASTLWLLFIIDCKSNRMGTHPPYEVYYVYKTGTAEYAVSAGLPAVALCLICAIPRTLKRLLPHCTAWKGWYTGAAALVLAAQTVCMLSASKWFTAFAKDLLGHRASAILEKMLACYLHALFPALAVCVLCWLICTTVDLARAPARIPQAARQTALHFLYSFAIVFLVTVASILILNILEPRYLVNKGSIYSFCLSNANNARSAQCSVLWAPVAEEIVFRGLICRGLAKSKRRWPAIVISAVYFGLWHRNRTQFAYTVVWGIIYGYIILTTDNVFWTMLMHALSNLLVILAFSESSSAVFGAWPGLCAFREWLWDLPVAVSGILLAVIAAAVVLLTRRYRPSAVPRPALASANE